MTKKHYEAEGIRVSYDSRRCIHAAECVRGLPAVFDAGRRPWIDAGAAPPDEVAGTVRSCPTGALRYERFDGGDAEAPPATNHIAVTAGGPLHAVGNLRFLDAERRPLTRETRAALCRCGASRNKPFCDGRHADVGFQDGGMLGEARLREASEETEPHLSIRLRENGPLVLEGRFTLAGATGGTSEGAAAALCRCGASRNRPFCDGSHREIGFEADDPSAGGESE